MNNIISTATHIMTAFPIHEAIEIIKKEGYSGVEIWHEEFVKQEKEGITSYGKVKKALIKTGLKAVVHATNKDHSGKRINICSKDERFRKRSLKMALESIDLARQLGLHLINIHPGHMDKEDDDPKDYWPILFDAFKELLKPAKEGNIILAVELMEKRPKEFFIKPRHIEKLINHFKSDNLGTTLDLTHAFTHGEEFPLMHLKEHGIHLHLRHFHASGFYGDKGKTHCGFKMDDEHKDYFIRILKKIIMNYDGIITIEGHLKGIMSETRENQIKLIRDNMDFIKQFVGGI